MICENRSKTGEEERLSVCIIPLYTLIQKKLHCNIQVALLYCLINFNLCKHYTDTHDAVIHSGSNEVTLQYPGGLIDTGEFRICVRSNN